MMKLVQIRTSAIAMAMLLAMQVVSSEAAIISFRKDAKVSSSVVTLGDIADIRDTDSATIERLSQIVVSPAPAFGRQLRLDFSTLRLQLQTRGVDIAGTQFSGASLVVVSSSENSTGGVGSGRNSRQVSSWKHDRAKRLVSEAVQQYVNRVAPELGTNTVTIDLKNEDVEEVLLGAVSGYQVTGGAAPWNAPQFFEIRFLDRREEIHAVGIRANVSRQPQILVAKYNVPKGQVLRGDDLVLRQTSSSQPAYSRLEDVLHRETTRMIRKDQPITRRDIREVPLIRSNDIVSVYSRKGRMSVKRRMKARSSGAIGETVKLVSLDGRQKIVARVSGYHEAEIGDTVNSGGRVVQAVGNQIPFRKSAPIPARFPSRISRLKSIKSQNLPQRPNLLGNSGRF